MKGLCVCLPRNIKNIPTVFTRFKTKEVKTLKTYFILTVFNTSYYLKNQFSKEERKGLCSRLLKQKRELNIRVVLAILGALFAMQFC